MKVAFFSVILNNHQANLADEMYRLLGENFVFVELENLHGNDKKGSTEDYSKRTYLLQSWKDEASVQKAMQIALTFDVCMFDGGFNFQKARMKTNKLTFEFSERWLKRGLINVLSPRLIKNIITYHIYGWSKKPLYKLCASAFAKHYQNVMGTFKGKCYKFGYYTKVVDNFVEASDADVSTKGKVHILWCARFLLWKHPELAVKLAERLKAEGYDVTIDMYGDEGHLALHDKPYPRKDLEALIEKTGTGDMVTLKGSRPNAEILQAMQEGDIFLFTSDRLEGWGAVANESMANGCVLVASDEIGSTAYLVKHEETGMVFKSCDVDSLYEQVKYLLDNPEERERISRAGRRQMVELWSPGNAARSLLQLIKDLQEGRETSIAEGPCSKA
jgi:glycosyltransferase involved in cell wall biosynthesis